MDNKKKEQKVYRLTESQFENVIENTIKRANETKSAKGDKKVIKENYGETTQNSIGMAVAGGVTITVVLKLVFSKYKELKTKYPSAPVGTVILNALSEVAKTIPR